MVEPSSTFRQAQCFVAHSAVTALADRVMRDSLFDSLPGVVCGTPGHPMTQTRQTREYVRHALTRPDASWQGRSISS
jgi:hypothetical protein